jgi:hypothetical protein
MDQSMQERLLARPVDLGFLALAYPTRVPRWELEGILIWGLRCAWDALFWNVMNRQCDFFLSNPRLAD